MCYPCGYPYKSSLSYCVNFVLFYTGDVRDKAEQEEINFRIYNEYHVAFYPHFNLYLGSN